MTQPPEPHGFYYDQARRRRIRSSPPIPPTSNVGLTSSGTASPARYPPAFNTIDFHIVANCRSWSIDGSCSPSTAGKALIRASDALYIDSGGCWVSAMACRNDGTILTDK